MSKRTIPLLLAAALLLSAPAMAAESSSWQFEDVAARILQEVHDVLSWLSFDDSSGDDLHEVSYAESTDSDDAGPGGTASEGVTDPNDEPGGDEVGGFIQPIG